MALFERRDVEQYTNSLVDYLPGGCLFAAASVRQSNFRKLLRGIAGELFRSNGLLIEYNNEILPDQTVKFLNEWESALGIPDGCLKGDGTLNERRRDILIKLAASGVQTAQDFVDLGALLGLTIVVRAGIDEITFPLTFPVLMFSTLREARFTIVVRFTETTPNVFPFTFPITFGSGEISLIECVFNKLKPANCNLIFESV